jgi:hypothetical protein
MAKQRCVQCEAIGQKPLIEQRHIVLDHAADRNVP